VGESRFPGVPLEDLLHAEHGHTLLVTALSGPWRGTGLGRAASRGETRRFDAGFSRHGFPPPKREQTAGGHRPRGKSSVAALRPTSNQMGDSVGACLVVAGARRSGCGGDLQDSPRPYL